MSAHSELLHLTCMLWIVKHILKMVVHKLEKTSVQIEE